MHNGSSAISNTWGFPLRKQIKSSFKINESRYKQWGVTPHSSARHIEKRQILALSIKKSFLTDPLTTKNAIYHDSLTLNAKFYWEKSKFQETQGRP